MYRLLTGGYPFHHPDWTEVAKQHVESPPPDVDWWSHVPPWFCRDAEDSVVADVAVQVSVPWFPRVRKSSVRATVPCTVIAPSGRTPKRGGVAPDPEIVPPVH